jgi:hypothetical protein
MASVSIVEYIHDLKEAGFTDKQSEVQARKLELVIAEVKSELKQDIKQELHIDELVTKKDLELAIEKIRYETLKFTVWTGVAVVMATSGMLAKGFHWF